MSFDKMSREELLVSAKKLFLANRRLTEETAVLHAPAHSPLFRSLKYSPGWSVINIFFQGHGNELIRVAVAFQRDIVTYQALVRTWLGDPRVHTDTAVTANNPKGFAVLPADVFLTQAEPCRSLRREALSFLKTAIQEGSAKAFCAQVEKLAELSFGVLAGAPFSPGSSSSGGGKGGGRWSSTSRRASTARKASTRCQRRRGRPPSSGS